MTELDIIQGRAFLQITIDQLTLWNDQKPNDKTQKLIGMVAHSLTQYNALEKNLRVNSQRSSDLELQVLKLSRSNEELQRLNQKITEEAELHKNQTEYIDQLEQELNELRSKR